MKFRSLSRFILVIAVAYAGVVAAGCQRTNRVAAGSAPSSNAPTYSENQSHIEKHPAVDMKTR